MLPQLSTIPGLRPLTARYLEELSARGFQGDVLTDYASRLVNATDNSVYQVLPQAVLCPKHHRDVALLVQLASQEPFRQISLSPRGGGTGTNGQSLTHGVIVDLSRYQNEILELNAAQGWVRVQPGVVLDQLNAFLKPHGLFFAPTLSPSNRATLGGMVATDACGKGSRVYGKTSGHILELDLVLSDGTEFTSGPMDEAEVQQTKQRSDRLGEAVRVVDDIVVQKRELIEQQFPKIPRFLTGYNLAHVRAPGKQFDLNPLIAGSEGTLAFVTGAKLRVLPIPAHKQLLAIRYGSFDDALRAAELLVEADPSAIETVDDKILSLARQDVIWHRVAHLLPEGPDEHTAAVNLVEFSATEAENLERQVRKLCTQLDANRGKPGQALGYVVAPSEQDAAALWDLRKKGVGLLGNAPGERRPIPFVEDTAVHPKQLASYIREFRAILDEAGVEYGMFGHVDVGCLHVRPALNLRDPKDERLFRQISDRVVDLVQRYGGVMWSEHGKGFRSEYSSRFFGEELYQDLCRVKHAFDPNNQLNPGKLAVPSEGQAQLVSVDALKRGHFDRQIEPSALQRFHVVVNCNGNGACFDYAADSVMCPSAKVTRDRIHSPKGRATVMREWLRQMSRHGFDTVGELKQAGVSRAAVDSAEGAAVTEADEQAWVSGGAGYDFSHEVHAAMDGCLSCKACATQCPVKVDVPQFKSEFLELYHRRYPRPLSDYLLAGLETLVVWMAWLPRLINALLAMGWVRASVRRLGGMVDTPKLSVASVKRGLRERNAPRFNRAALSGLSEEERQRSVLLVQDPFSTYFDAEVTLANYDLLTDLGYRVYVVPYRPNGKALHVKGFLQRFRRLAESNVEYFRELAELNIPMVGIEPATTLVYREEYPRTLGEPVGFRVYLLQEWLASRREQIRGELARRGFASPGTRYTLMGHCTERTAEPKSQQQWREVFEAFGLALSLEAVGCCGMCGSYGHEARHLEESRGIYAMSWQRHLPAEGPERDDYLAPGFSCRSQVKRFSADHRPLRHPAQALLEVLRHAQQQAGASTAAARETQRAALVSSDESRASFVSL